MKFTLSSGWEIGTRWQGGRREAWAGSAGCSVDEITARILAVARRAAAGLFQWANERGKGGAEGEDGSTHLRFWPCGRPGRCRPRGRWAGWTASTR